MALPTLFEICEPRDDVLAGTLQESDFAADLAQVLRGAGPEDYRVAARFFDNTHPTRGLRTLLAQVLGRLSGNGSAVSPIFRLDTQYGGGKTHSLIALTHAAAGMQNVRNISEFVDPALLPTSKVRIAAFDGENADPANGRTLASGIRALTPWGEIAFALAGAAGFERLRKSDELGIAPGADTLRELFAGEPTLILLDELSIYLRKVQKIAGAREQLTAFLTSLFKAVEGTSNACLVFTLAIGKDGRSTDAYAAENQFVAEGLLEIESVAARKATLLDPTAEDETVQVLRRRLFKSIDETKVSLAVEAYRAVWQSQRELLPQTRVNEDRAVELANGYPLHPALMGVLTSKLSTLSTFQRVRGMLRLLARTVARLWQQRPVGTYAIHIHHVDPGDEGILNEILVRLSMQRFEPAIRNDVAARDGTKFALAQELDQLHYAGMAPYTAYSARTILLHSFAFNSDLQGATADELRYAVLAPGLELAFVEDARKRFVGDSAYLDDRPNAPMRFLTEANLTQIIRRQQDQVDPGTVRGELNDRIRALFSTSGSLLELVPFAAGPGDVPDDPGAGRPYLVLLHPDSVAVHQDRVSIPAIVEKIYRHKSDGAADFRALLNNVCFLAPDEALRDDMRRTVARRLALFELRKPDRIRELAQHQQDQLQQMFAQSEQQIAIAIQQAFRHLFYPTRNRLDGSPVDLGHAVIDKGLTSFAPGQGQLQVVRVLREARKLRTSEDQPDSPTYIRDRTPLRKGQISTASLRDEFRRDPSLPMLVGDDIFRKGVVQGIEQGEYVYLSGDMTVGKGDPWPSIRIDEQSFVYTAEYARTHGIWPRKPPAPPVGQVSAPHGVTVVSGGISSGRTDSGSPAAARTEAKSSGGPSSQVGADSGEVSVEAPLASALSQLWGQARAKGYSSLARIVLRLFDHADAFKMLGAVSTLVGPKRTVALDAHYETSNGSTCDCSFDGGLEDAKVLKEFLEPQVRAARDKAVDATFTLEFPNGLALGDDGPEKLAAQLVRFVTGAALVKATASSGAK